MHILGVSCFYHDSAAALLKDGYLVAAAEEERFSRVKHDYSFPASAIEFCLHQAGITGQDLDYVVFYEKPLLKFERILMSTLGSFPNSWKTFGEAMIAWFDEKLWIKDALAKYLAVPQEKVLFVEHHLSHAASTFFASPYHEAAILTIDGVGEWTTTTIGRGCADWDGTGSNGIALLDETRFPHSLGLLYSTFTAFLGFRVNNGEYKVMGMAPYGRPNRMEDVYKLIDVADDGSFQLNMDYFAYHHSSSETFNKRFEDLFGTRRTHDSIFYTPTTHPKKDHPQWDDETAQQNQYYADIAASVQRVTEETLLKMARHIQESTGLKHLCMAGGVALNSVANGRILRETPFEEVWIQPAAGDSGGALGAALYAYHILLGEPRKFVQEHSFWGKGYSTDEVHACLERASVQYQRESNEEVLTGLMLEDLLEGKVIGVYQGRFEWGPRALGNRSILADPRRADMKDIVNTKIKFREPFRPFAPVVLEERAPEFYSGLTEPHRHYPFRYMLMVFPVVEEKQPLLPAVTHEGGSGRLQTIRREWNPRYYRVVERFGDETGIPILLNTSFNLRGEPIVTTPENALNTFSKSGIDTLYIDDFVVRKG
jgi:carbamoyltransferase